jgi:xylono-1,5-lactonase
MTGRSWHKGSRLRLGPFFYLKGKSAMTVQITNLLAEPADLSLPLSQLGEGAYFDLASQRLFWVDIEGKTIHVLNLVSKAHSSWTLAKKVTFAVPNDGRMLVCLEDGVYDYDPQTGEERATTTLSLPLGHRLNDGKVSPEGRLWVGTIDTSDHPSETAGLFVLDDNSLKLVESGYENANGKAWSPDGTIMYHADTARSTIWQYDYDPQSGKLSVKREFAKIDNGNPDGLCADDHGRVYAAIYGGERIDVFEPDGRRIAVVAVPVPNPTSCTLRRVSRTCSISPRHMTGWTTTNAQNIR